MMIDHGLAAILENEGYHSAAADILAGVDVDIATSYIVATDNYKPRYDDGESRWLYDFLTQLHGIVPPGE